METEHKHQSAKYDRQLRLWGVQGQKTLMESKICLLSCEPAGVETLKNLILPGVGSITIVDDQIVNDRDLGKNFFVTEDDIGKPRAEAVKHWLTELNPDVTGAALVQSPSHVLENNPDYFKQFGMIILTETTEKLTLAVGELCALNNISLIVIRSSGFIGSLRIYSPIHTIVEGKIERDLDGYTLSAPFPELTEYINKFDLAKLQDFEHRHVPYFVVLVKYLQQWKEENGGKVPSTFAEKQKFGEYLKSKSREWFEEENFQEAVKYAHKIFLPADRVPDNVAKVFDSDLLKEVNSSSTNFWVLVEALRRFYTTHKAFPVRSSLPDLTSDTESYLQLKRIYEKKSEQDREQIQTEIDNILKGTDRKIAIDEVKLFLENIFNIDFLSFRTLAQEVDTPIELEVFETDCYKWHFALRANAKFLELHNRYPSSNNEDDAKLLNELLTGLQSKVPGLMAVEEENVQICKEMARYEGSQLHTIASFLGGVASQEGIKLLTHQFKPLNNTYVYNGITSEAEVYEF